ncbi:MAG: helix-turn-helix transcriptional regulator [Bacteroidia bacterium]|nr:helix-turn-helix transcriptional regulator [Bacteroidia bacterium]
MKRRLLILCFLVCWLADAQYSFSGWVDTNSYDGDIYLSVIDDYRKLSGIYSEQIIARIKADSSGHFEFSGNQLEDKHQIYRVHVDNCENGNGLNHFSGHCPDSREVLFLAKNTDSISFPFGFENEMFCDVKSSNESAMALIRIDSLKEHMRYALSEIRSSANTRLNTKKWFTNLQEFGMNLEEPLAELYIYEFLSDRSSDYYDYYLSDLKDNAFYGNLENKLNLNYPDSDLSDQYRTELAADRFAIDQGRSGSKWLWLLYIILGISILINFITLFKLRFRKSRKNSSTKASLTPQEQKILEHILSDHTNKDIAEAMFVSVSTVKSHINSIYKKMGVQSRQEVKSLFNK